METLKQAAERVGKLIEQHIAKLPADAPVVYDCAACKDVGFVTREDARYRGGRETVPCAECLLRKRIAMNVPENYRAARLTHFPEGVRAATERWLAGSPGASVKNKPTRGLMLAGPCGTGKTYLAWAALMVWWARPASGQFWRAEQLYRKMRDAYTLKLTETDVLHDAFTTGLLVLDDICAGNLSDHERRITLEILNEREDQRRPTVVTTNSTLEKVGAWDDRIASRLAAYELVEFEGKDRRMG